MGCSGNGKCDTNLGICRCNDGFTGSDCASKPITNLAMKFQENVPLVNFTIPNIQDSYQSMSVSETAYSGLLSIEEYTNDGQIVKVITPPTWTISPINNTNLFSRVNYSAPIVGGGNLIVTVFNTKANSNTTFLGQVITLTPNQQYFTVLIEGYKFSAPDAYLAFVFEMGLALPPNSTRVCIMRNQDDFSDNIVNYRLHLNDVMMNGRFIEKALVDGNTLDTSSEFGRFQQRNSEASTQIIVRIPTFNQSALFAQDFLPTLNSQAQANIKTCVTVNRPTTTSPTEPPTNPTPTMIPPEPSPTNPSNASSLEFNFNLLVCFVLLGCLFTFFL